jgi:hypothetical protein
MEILCTTSGRKTDEFQSVMGVRKTEDGQKRVQRQGTASGPDRDRKREEASSRQRGAHFRNHQQTQISSSNFNANSENNWMVDLNIFNKDVKF